MSESINFVLSVPVMIYKLVQFHRFSSTWIYIDTYSTENKIRQILFLLQSFHHWKTEKQN